MLELNILSNSSDVIFGTELIISVRALPTELSGATFPARTSSTYTKTASRRPDSLFVASAILARSIIGSTVSLCDIAVLLASWTEEKMSTEKEIIENRMRQF